MKMIPKHKKTNHTKTAINTKKILTNLITLTMIFSIISIYTVGTVKSASNFPFEDGFESGSFSSWTRTYVTSGQTTRIVTSQKYSGTYGAEFVINSNRGYQYAQTIQTTDSLSELYARAYINVDSNGLNDNGDKLYFIRFTAGNENVLWAGWRRSGTNIRWQLLIRDGSGYVSEYSDLVPITGKWYCIEAYWKNDGRTGKSALWVNGNQILTLENKDTNNYGAVTAVQFGVAEAYQLDYTRVYGDNFAISNQYIGEFQNNTTPSPDSQSNDNNGSEETFESGNFEDWSGTETTSGEIVSISTNNPYQGNYNARFSSDGGSGTENAYIFKNVNEDIVYAGGYFNIIQDLPLDDNNDRFYLTRFIADGQSVAGVGLRRDSGEMKWVAYGRDGSSWNWPTYSITPAIEQNHWYKLRTILATRLH